MKLLSLITKIVIVSLFFCSPLQADIFYSLDISWWEENKTEYYQSINSESELYSIEENYRQTTLIYGSVLGYQLNEWIGLGLSYLKRDESTSYRTRSMLSTEKFSTLAETVMVGTYLGFDLDVVRLGFNYFPYVNYSYTEKDQSGDTQTSERMQDPAWQTSLGFPVQLGNLQMALVAKWLHVQYKESSEIQKSQTTYVYPAFELRWDF